jgi:hypothetical protein
MLQSVAYGAMFRNSDSILRSQITIAPSRRPEAADGIFVFADGIAASPEPVCVVTAGHYTDAMQNWLSLPLPNRDVLPAVA